MKKRFLKKNSILSTIIIFCTSTIIISSLPNCTSTEKKDDVVVLKDSIVPVPLPVSGTFKFPEDSVNIYNWLDSQNTDKIDAHAWGIWAGLTSPSGQVFNGDSLLVFETWLGISEIQQLVMNDQNSANNKTSRTKLSAPKQFEHALAFQAAKGQVDTSAGQGFGKNFWVTVSYNPSATDYVLKNEILKQSKLDSYKKKDSIGSIPPFPNDAITIKPTYYVGKVTDDLIRIPAWPGTPSPAKAYDPASGIWNSYIYVDVNNKQQPGKALVPVKNGEGPTPASTCNLNDFIYFKVDSAMASYLNQRQEAVQGDTAMAGDLALLVAMHVTTKEISNWTWQTFYWAPNPNDPLLPSSKQTAGIRNNAGLKGAASHYALSTAYAMVLPNQPISGGTNKGVKPVIGYNPYLEAGFAPGTFSLKNALNPKFVYGVQTNCMSCHALVTSDGALGYTTDQYIDMRDTMFKNKVQLDFAWSIQQAIIKNK